MTIENIRAVANYLKTNKITLAIVEGSTDQQEKIIKDLGLNNGQLGEVVNEIKNGNDAEVVAARIELQKEGIIPSPPPAGGAPSGEAPPAEGAPPVGGEAPPAGGAPAGEAPPAEGTPPPAEGAPPPADEAGKQEGDGIFGTLTKNWPWVGVVVGAILGLFGFYKASSESHSGSFITGLVGAAVAVFSLLFKFPGLVGAEKKANE